MNQTFKADIAIFGGGIAGLWILNRLCQKGYNCVLIENQSLGGMQTLACQGMIHGGQKFALPGSAQSKQQSLAGSIAKMPAIWHDCLKGTGEIDLSKARVLSENQFMWSPGGITGSATAFLASKLMNARVTLVKNSDQWPDVFYENRQIKGRLYRMDEEVVSVKSVVNALNARFTDTIYRADINEIVVKNNNVEYIDLVDGQNRIKLSASGFVFTAGVGNEKVAEAIGLTGRVTQRRPLKQVMVRNVPYALYAHCISMNPKPRVTITAHPEENNTYVWYLGGLVAEQGVEKTDEQAIDFARQEMEKLFPWINWSALEWAVLYVDRAEPYAGGSFLPDSPAIHTQGNSAIAWPAKMTFAPLLADKIIEWISSQNIVPKYVKTELRLSKPETGRYPWESVKDWKK